VYVPFTNILVKTKSIATLHEASLCLLLAYPPSQFQQEEAAIILCLHG
jgi:hypothetical protein